MTTYDASSVSDAVIAFRKPITLQQGRGLRDNPIAMAEGAAGAPRIQGNAHPEFSADDTYIVARITSPDTQVDAVVFTGSNISASASEIFYSFTAMNDGELRFSTEYKRVSEADRIYFAILVNGVVLSEVSSTSTSFVSASIDASYSQSDLVEIRFKIDFVIGSGGGTAIGAIRNLQIKADQIGVYRT